jgi:formylglycine-generating enzyme required for sulfatase activity
MYIKRIISVCILVFPIVLRAQEIRDVSLFQDLQGKVRGIILNDSTSFYLQEPKPLFTFLIDGRPYSSAEPSPSENQEPGSPFYAGSVKVTIINNARASEKWSTQILFENIGSDTVTLSNVVPFGEDPSSVFITGFGKPDLARACLFKPGFSPLRVILPDNAWELGYSSFKISESISISSLARRIKTMGAVRRRYETIMPPRSNVVYELHADLFRGDWQEGLKQMFRDNYLFDTGTFDETLYRRTDLAWIRKSYLIILQMAWDAGFYDRFRSRYTFPELLRDVAAQFGYLDVYGIWPTWPRLGLDQRNQWDLYRDLPGGTEQLRNFARMARLSGTKFFIAYNPWDNSTRKEDHLRGMAGLIKDIEADGVVLDTRGSSSYELQANADSVREGVVMYSEGMAVVREMQGILSGRVHNAIFLSPELNLNKLIRPDFAIFRVCDVGEDKLHREIAISFFNGYGTELNLFRPGGRNDSYEEDLSFLAKTTFILRQNSDAFLDRDWTPLAEGSADRIYINSWSAGEKKVYTVLNMDHEGYMGKLVKIEDKPGKHYISLWNNEELVPMKNNTGTFLPVSTHGWPVSNNGTRLEGSVDCIAGFPVLLKTVLSGDRLRIESPEGFRILLWKGVPSYNIKPLEFSSGTDTLIDARKIFGAFEGKMTVQLIKDGNLADMRIHEIRGGKPWLISTTERTKPATTVPQDMILIPGSLFTYKVSATDEFIPYPDADRAGILIDSFLIDRYPVTNEQFYQFMINSGYIPADTARFLRHWQSGIYRQGQEKYPVVNISYEDARAYAAWAGKRLPAEGEWQLASQGTDGRKWPWGDEFHGTYCNNSFNRPTPVDAFTKGQSPYGVVDLVGNVWQMTDDLYFNGTNYFLVIRGGSYYNPDSSGWYIKGGPQALDQTQMLLLVSPGFDRSSTVGFRCVRDIDKREFRQKR